VSDAPPLGLLAGDGRFPLEVARAARARGRPVVAVGFHGVTSARLDGEVDELHRIHLGELGKLVANLRRAGVRDVVMAGKVSKQHLFGDLEALRPDARALAFFAGLRDWRDDSILGGLAELLAGEGLVLCAQLEQVPELGAREGLLGAVALEPAQAEDVRFGWPLAKAIAGLDIGQTLVVKSRAVIAVEAIEGTDQAIRRGGELSGGGAVVVKVAKPRQDPRFDLPAIGLDTLDALVAAGARALAFEAGGTIVLDRPELVRRADAAGIALLGVGPDGPPPGAPEPR
jgi:DUF1009 family protein